MNRPVSEQEIKAAVFQLGPSKAPGPDGIPVSFFQQHWSVVGNMVIKFDTEVFVTGYVPESMNCSLICLLSKLTHPETIAQFRPICLSNVIIKVITKIIANRLHPVMGDLIHKEQTGFIPGRHTTDNIVIAQECLHSLHRKKGKKGFMVVKIDLEKAYDRID